MTTERWKQIKKYPDYVISNKGRIRSLITGLILRPFLTDAGYYTVTLYKEKKKKQFYVHRIVAEEFLHNKDRINKNQVNHIDGNKTNNVVENLEWVTPQENKEHAMKKGLIKKFGKQKEVIQMDLQGNEIAKFVSAGEASRVVGISQGNISNVCRGYGCYGKNGSAIHHKTAGGYLWKYAN